MLRKASKQPRALQFIGTKPLGCDRRRRRGCIERYTSKSYREIPARQGITQGGGCHVGCLWAVIGPATPATRSVIHMHKARGNPGRGLLWLIELHGYPT